MDLSIGVDGVLYAATHSRGIWSYPLGTTSSTTAKGGTKTSRR